MSRPENKLFTIDGLAEDDVEALKLYPNYVLMPEAVYIDVMSAMLDGLNDLSVLELPRVNSEELGSELRSWIPDWNDSSRIADALTPEEKARRISLRRDPQDADKDAKEPHAVQLSRLEAFEAIQRFNAAKDSFPSLVQRNNGHLLSLQGLMCDTILETTGVLATIDHDMS